MKAIMCAVITGKALYLLTSWGKVGQWWEHLLGFVFYGGGIGAFIGIYISAKGVGEFVGDYLDVFCSILPLGQAIGRIGCFFNGCCYGRETSCFFSVLYPINGEMKYVYPTWFIESVICLLIFIWMQFGMKTTRRWVHTSFYLIGYGVGRFFIEFFRGDTIRGRFGSFSTSQWLSFAVVSVGIGLMIKAYRTYHRNYLLRRRLN